MRSMHNLHIEYSDDFSSLCALHKENMNGKGPNKPEKFFDLVKKYISPEKYELSYAVLNGERIGGLLIFYFKETVEYFTPAFNRDFQAEQATSFLIFHAMKNAIRKGYKFWNFGGTRLPGQEGVAKFKKSWGATEFPYYYFTTIHRDIDHLKRLDPKTITENYPWFYVIPF